MLIRNKIIFFVLCIIYSGLHAQQNARSYFDSIVNTTEIPFEEKQLAIETLLQSNDTIAVDDQAYLNYQYWRILWNNKKRAKVQKYILKEFELRKSLNDQVLLKRNLYNLGYVHSRLSNPEFEQALHYFDTLLVMTDKTETRLGSIYREKGDIYEQLGDFQRALENYHNAERIQKQQNLSEKLLKTYVNISSAFARLQDSAYFDDFIKNKEKLDALCNEFELSKYQQTILMMNEGTMYATKHDYKESSVSYKKAENLAKETQIDEAIFGALNNLGLNAIKLGQFDLAASYFKEAAHYSKGDREHEGSILDNTGDLQMELGNYKEALSNYQQAISYLLTGSNQLEVDALPTLEEIKISPYKIDILEYLIDKSEALFTVFRITKESDYLLQANQAIILIDQLIDELYFESREALTKLFWRKKGAQLYVMAVATCFELGDEERALYYMEKNKGIMLLENISNTKAKQLGNVPNKVITRMRSFEMEIKQLQSELSSLAATIPLRHSDSLKATVFAKKEAYRAMIDSLAFSYPNYYQYKKQIEIVSSNSVIKDLNNEENILSYIIGDNEGYVAMISTSRIRLKRIDNIKELNRDIAKFGASLQKPFQSKDDEHAYRQIAFRLKEKLMPFSSLKTNDKLRQLSIVPDGNIYAVPFEALITNPDAPISESYLIENLEIHYRYSLSVDSQMKQQSTQDVSSFVGFVPRTFKANYLPSLNNSDNEIDEVSSILGGRVFTDSMATKNNFLRAYSNSTIVHLSTHGSFDNNNPSLGFYDERLFLDELYFLNSNKDLVVLSACKTAIGSQAAGEGVFNFTRGFINSGAKSVVTTLWDVNEKSSSEVIGEFYNNLVSGKTKSESLRQAKLSYLDRHKNTSEASPFYWSAIVLTGDNSPITSSNPWVIYLCIFIFIALLFIGFMLLKKRRSLTSN